MAEINPPGFLQNRADHTGRDMRGAYSDMISQPGVESATDWIVTQRAAGANMSVDISQGSGYVLGSEASNQGYYHCMSDATPVNKTVTASSGTQTRKDIVVARVYDTFYSGVSNLWQFEIIAGTFGSGVEPAVPANSYKVATIDVDISAASIINAKITRRATRFAVAGTAILVATQAARDALPLFAGLSVYRLDLNAYQYYTGGSWGQLLNASDSGWITSGFVAGSGWTIGAARTRKRQGIVYTEGSTNRTGATITSSASGTHAGNIAGDPPLLTVPAGYRPTVPAGMTHIPGSFRSSYGVVAGGITAAGVVFISAMAPGATIIAGEDVIFDFTYPED